MPDRVEPPEDSLVKAFWQVVDDEIGHRHRSFEVRSTCVFRADASLVSSPFLDRFVCRSWVSTSTLTTSSESPLETAKVGATSGWSPKCSAQQQWHRQVTQTLLCVVAPCLISLHQRIQCHLYCCSNPVPISRQRHGAAAGVQIPSRSFGYRACCRLFRRL